MDNNKVKNYNITGWKVELLESEGFVEWVELYTIQFPLQCSHDGKLWSLRNNPIVKIPISNGMFEEFSLYWFDYTEII